MKKLTLSLLAVTLIFLAPDLAKAERFEAIPAAIIDTETGIMWLSEPCCIHGSWEESEAFTAGLDYAGYQDWRAPTIEELGALFEAIGNHSAFPTQTDSPLFNDVQRYYWTTTPYMAFDISDSTVFYDDVNPYWIWPVRTAFIPTTTDQPIVEGGYDASGKVGGDSDRMAGSNRSPIGPPVRNPFGKCCTCTGTLHGTRWCDNGNGTVTDMTTCLVWLKKADCAERMTWNDAIRWPIVSLRNGDCGSSLSDGSVWGDWRLPTKSELYGAANGTEAVRSGNMRAFTGVLSDFYWSSTTSASNPYYTWLVDLVDGGVNSYNKDYRNHVWPVRSGN